MSRTVRLAAAAAAAAVLAASCGYHLRGTGTFLPSGIKKVAVPLFVNKTTRYQLDLKLTQGVINELAARGKVEITTDVQAADAVLTGEILSYNANPIAFSNQRTADRYNIVVAARITLKEAKSGGVIYENPSYVFQTEFEVPQGQDFQSSETEAITRLAERFARNLVLNILEGF